MKMFTTINESGEPIAATYTCIQTESKWTLGTVPQGVKVPEWGCLSIPRVSCPAIGNWRWPGGLQTLGHW